MALTHVSPSPPYPRRRARRARQGLAGALAALGLLLGLAALARPEPASAYSTATQFTITGRGYGHGIGMSQWGAYGYAKYGGFSYKQILAHYYTNTALGRVPNDVIRVRLRGGLSSVKLTCASSYRAAVTGSVFKIPAGVTATVTYVNSRYKVSAGGRSKSFGSPVTFTPDAGSLKVLTASDLGRTGRYRGVIRVARYDGALMIVNKLPMESYLRGVLPIEVSYTWPAESLKAQACAARSYAQRSRDPDLAFDVYCSVRDQAYGGRDVEHSETNAAIKATAGEVPTYNGTPIVAYFFSTSGGETENIEYAWNTTAVPYLKGVKDEYESQTPASYKSWGPIRRAGSTVDRSLGSLVQGTLRAVYVVKRGVSPRIVRAAVIGSKGTTFVHGASLRVYLGLKSSWAYTTSMSINPAAANKATITAGQSITLKGRLYPAVADGETVTLHYNNDGEWHTRAVATTRQTEALPGDLTAAYSAYSFTASPQRTTTYYFSRGENQRFKSPQTTVTVKAAASLSAEDVEAAAGELLTFVAGVAPPRPAGTVWLQTRSGSTWTDAMSGELDDASGCAFTWTAATGVDAVRLRVPAVNGLAASFSPAVTLTIQ
jgi:stage II sporulation protein D